MDVRCSVLDTTDDCRVGSHWANGTLLESKEETVLYSQCTLDPFIAFPPFNFRVHVLLNKETKDRGEGMKRGPASTGGEAEVLTTQQIILLPGESVREEKHTLH